MADPRDPHGHLAHEFSMLDANKDGSLSPEELFDGLCKRGYEQDELQNLFAMLDTNGDGKVSLTEYLDGMESVHGAKMLRNWVKKIPISDDAREMILRVLEEQEIRTLDVLQSCVEDLTSLDEIKKLKMGVKTALKKALSSLGARGGDDDDDDALKSKPPDSADMYKVVDMSTDSVGKILTTMEALRGNLNPNEAMYGHFTSEVALKGIHQKGFRVSQEGQGAGGFYLVSEESLKVMMQGSSNKFDRESFLSTAYSLFGPTCEKRKPGDISVLVLLKAGTRYVEPVPIDTADVRASGCPALHYIPLNVVADIGRMDESDGFQYIQWQNRIIKSYKVYTEESAKGSTTLKEASHALGKRVKALQESKKPKPAAQPKAAPAAAPTEPAPNVKYPRTITFDGFSFMLSGWNGDYHIQDEKRDGRPVWRRSGAVKMMVPIIPTDIWWDKGKNRWIVHRDGDSDSKAMKKSSHTNPTPVGKWEDGCTCR